jgi:excisionase family DNA binding protein
MLNDLLRGEEVARVLGVSRSFAYLLMKRGDLPVIRFGRAVRVRREDLEKYILKSTFKISHEKVTTQEAANSIKQNEAKQMVEFRTAFQDSFSNVGENDGGSRM